MLHLTAFGGDLRVAIEWPGIVLIALAICMAAMPRVCRHD